MTRRTTTFSIAGTLLVILLFVAALGPIPYVELSPGPTFNTIGSYEGKPLISISGASTYPASGNLDMVTVSETGGAYGRLTFGQAIAGLLQGGTVVLPRALLYPDNQSSQAAVAQGAQQFTASQSDATAAALLYLRIPVTTQVYVASVVAGAPADGRLQAGDRIHSIDGVDVTSPDQVGKLVRARPAGQHVYFLVERSGRYVSVDLVAAPRPGDRSHSYVGLEVTSQYVGPFKIKFQLDDVGGPSAGLMFALGIIDLLTPGSINGGRHVAGTGTISPDGSVGAIGGIAQKMVAARDAGAVLFLAPKDNCGDVLGHVPAGLTVVAVGSLTDAINAISAWRAGVSVPSCSSGH